ncbi:MAG: hypothetical protein KKF56_04340 [Nanoarchaeota archaeon]|nr:hypothetical protein [Nanoarchaeota archaeon]
MRKIETKESREKKDKRNKLIIGIILIGLMVVSTAGYASFGGGGGDDSESKVVYNGYEFFELGNGYWGTVYGEGELITAYNPEETEEIIVPYVTLNQYYGNILYFDSESKEIKDEISRVLFPYVTRIQDGCLYEDDCQGDWPIKNCTSNMIIVRNSPETYIQKEDNCIMINYVNESLKVADAFIFRAFEIT